MDSRFTLLDWCILSAFPAVSIVVGFLSRRYVGQMDDFILAGRTIRPRLGLASIIASEMGLMIFIFSAQQGLTRAMSAFAIAVLSGLVCLAIAAGGVVAQPLRRMGVRTLAEFYRRRFSRGVGAIGGLLLVATGVLSVALLLKNGGLFLLNLIGLEEHRLPTVICLLLGVVVLYTTLGGIVSVFMKDYLQFVLLTVGLMLTMLLSVQTMEWDNIFQTIDYLRGRGGVNPLHPEATFFQRLGPETLWLVVALVGSCTVVQSLLLRTGATENVPAMRKTFKWASLGFLMRMLIPMFIGICSLVYLTQWPSLKAAILWAGRVEDQDVASLATATFLNRFLPVGVLGLVAAAMVGAFMSALDSCLVAWSAVVSQDVLAPLSRRRPNDRQQVMMARLLVPLLALLTLIWGLAIPRTYDLWHYVMGIAAVYFAGAMPAVFLGIYWKRASAAGAYAAFFVSFGSLLGFKPVQAALGLAWRPAVVHLITLAGAFAAMVVVSLIRPSRPADEDWNADHPSAFPPAAPRRLRVEVAPDPLHTASFTQGAAPPAPQPPQKADPAAREDQL